MGKSYNPVLVLFYVFSGMLLSSCLSLSVYVPHRGELNGRDVAPSHLPQILVSDPHQEKMQETYFATRSPCLFFMAHRKIQNRYGIPSQLIREEIEKYHHLYFPSDVKYSSIEIVVEKFKLFSNDRCFSNETNIDVNINVTGTIDGVRVDVLKYEFSDKIKSRVTELYMVSILGTIPVIAYAGFRGNRQDQMNKLGKIALLGFFENLQLVLRGANVAPHVL